MKKKKQKGFTLIELLGVLVVLSIILLIAIPSFTNNNEKANKNYYETLKGNVELAAMDYFSDYRTLLPQEIGNIKIIDVKTLIDNNYIDELLDVKKKNCGGTVTARKLENGSYDYTACLTCSAYLLNEEEKQICNLKEEDNNNVTIVGIQNQTIGQGENFTLPVAYAMINGQKVATLNAHPEDIDTNILGDHHFLYQYREQTADMTVTVVDKTVPQINITLKELNTNKEIASNTWTNSDLEIIITATDWTKQNVIGSGIDKIYYSLDNQKTWQELTPDNNGQASFFIKEEFNKTIYVKATDKAGNTSIITNTSIKIDKTPPLLRVSGNPGSWTNYSITISLIASDNGSGLDNQAYSYDGGITWTSQKTSTFTNRANVSFKVRDKAGNITTQTEAILIDKISPTGTLQTNTNWTTTGKTVTINASDNESGIKYYQSYSYETMQLTLLTTNSYYTTEPYTAVLLTDKAGNSQYIYTQTYIDVDAPYTPTLQIEKTYANGARKIECKKNDPTTHEINDCDVYGAGTITITGNDDYQTHPWGASGVLYREKKEYNANGSVILNWYRIKAGTGFPPRQYGADTIEYRAIDYVGHTSNILRVHFYD